MTNHPVTSVTVARAARLLGVPLIAVLLAGCGALGGGGDATAASAAPVGAASEATAPPAGDAAPSQEPPTQGPSAVPDGSGQSSGGSGQARTGAPGGTLADGATAS